MINKTEFKSLFDTYFDAIRSFIFYRCGNTDVASDIAQDVFLKVWEKREQLNNSNLKALLYKIANEIIISNYRKEKSRNNYEQSIILHNQLTLSPEDEMLYNDFVSSYTKALEEMPEIQRVVFLMSRNDDLKYYEIAERLGVSVKTVEKRISAAIQFLKKEFLLTV